MTAHNDTLKCHNAECGKSFGVIAREEKFYRDKQLPLPQHCPECRHRQRMALRSERKLYRRTCAKCCKSVLSTYPEAAPYAICCQECFWADIG